MRMPAGRFRGRSIYRLPLAYLEEVLEWGELSREQWECVKMVVSKRKWMGRRR